MGGGPLWQTQSGQEEDRTRRWIAVAAGAVLILIVLVLIALFSGGERRALQAAQEEHPYAEHLRISDVQMATASTFLGARVYYIDAMLHNHGERTVTGLRVEATFRDSLGQVVQRESLRALVLFQRLGHTDVVDMSMAPVAPGEVGQFRLTLEHISAQWGGQYPELRIVDVTLQ